MLPRATHTRSAREAARGKQGGRTQEIQRLIGRSLRACIDLAAIGERTITIDCDVLQADGGTRTAAITGGYVALADAIDTLMSRKQLAANPLHGQVAAVSVGIVKGEAVLDLEYSEDVDAETDMNVVMNSGGAFIEVQGTAEGHAFRREELDAMLNLAASGTAQLFGLQLQARQRTERHRFSSHARRVVHRDRQSREAARDARDPGRPRPRARGAVGVRHRAARRGRRQLRRERAHQGAPCGGGSGLPAIADDSGLEVDALGGRPGIHTARYAGPEVDDAANIDKLLAELAGVPAARRGARYRCAMVFVRSAGGCRADRRRGAPGKARIGFARRGSGGFGYDPLFIVAGGTVTAAEMPEAEKNRVSHRGKALVELAAKMALAGW